MVILYPIELGICDVSFSRGSIKITYRLSSKLTASPIYDKYYLRQNELLRLEETPSLRPSF